MKTTPTHNGSYFRPFARDTHKHQPIADEPQDPHYYQHVVDRVFAGHREFGITAAQMTAKEAE